MHKKMFWKIQNKIGNGIRRWNVDNLVCPSHNYKHSTPHAARNAMLLWQPFIN